jgi:N-acetyl-anhydromuramyl-L-alanine amidase AmpD
VVIAADGRLARVVHDSDVAWHAGEHNAKYLGVELVQPRQGDPITPAQYRTLAWWLTQMSAKYGFPLYWDRLPEHRETPQGRRVGKSDVGYPYMWTELRKWL